MRLFAIVALALLASCASTPRTQVYEGTFRWTMEYSAFQLDGAAPDDHWWVYFQRHEDGQRAVDLARDGRVEARAVLRGYVQTCETGCGAHSLYSHLFVVSEALSFSPVSAPPSDN